MKKFMAPTLWDNSSYYFIEQLFLLSGLTPFPFVRFDHPIGLKMPKKGN